MDKKTEDKLGDAFGMTLLVGGPTLTVGAASTIAGIQDNNPDTLRLGLKLMLITAGIGAAFSGNYLSQKYKTSYLVKNGIKTQIHALAANFVRESSPEDVEEMEETIRKNLEAEKDPHKRKMLKTMLTAIKNAKKELPIIQGGDDRGREIVGRIAAESGKHFKEYLRLRRSGIRELIELPEYSGKGAIAVGTATVAALALSIFTASFLSAASASNPAAPEHDAMRTILSKGPKLAIGLPLLGAGIMASWKLSEGKHKVKHAKEHLKAARSKIREIIKNVDTKTLRSAIREARLARFRAKSGMEYQMWAEVEKELQRVAERKGIGERSKVLRALHL